MSDIEDKELNLEELEYNIVNLMDKSSIAEMLRIQVAEIEMLKSMFSNPGEFCMDAIGTIVDVNDFIDGKSNILPTRLDFTLNLTLEMMKLEVCVTFPHEYPTLEPDIFVRSDKLTREQQHSLNTELATFILNLDRGEICITSAVFWLQENASQYVKIDPPAAAALINKQESSDEESDTMMFVRYWIYSHHIYSRIKRREILDLSNEYNITGFCLPGRPGIICAEGTARNCGDWWQKVKCMNWKRIMCKKKELIPMSSDQEINELRKFGPLKEISFEAAKTKAREFHMDMGELYRYLNAHDCGYVFKDYFGFDGRK